MRAVIRRGVGRCARRAGSGARLLHLLRRSRRRVARAGRTRLTIRLAGLALALRRLVRERLALRGETTLWITPLQRVSLAERLRSDLLEFGHRLQERLVSDPVLGLGLAHGFPRRPLVVV